ncbi:hypothetical protein [Candidatus Avelusimicrobium stercoris]|uniref:hypothetical protein n=1 Tax=Candidatus Avelusimicrobium stercoris TaxID=1947924 RepID=UPI003D116096
MKKLFTLFSLVFSFAPCGAQEIHLIEQKAADKVPFAAPFALQFSLSHTPGYEVSVDENSLSKDFEITQMSAKQNSPGTLTYDFTALPFTLGKSTFTVTFNLVQNGRTAAQTKAEAYIDITPAKTFNDKNLREIRNPSIPAGWLAWLVAALLLGALIYVLYAWHKKLHEKELSVSAEPEDSRPGNEIALSQIDALLDSGLWENAQYKVFYNTLTDILREYLWRQLKIDASADTSAEILARIKTMPKLAPLRTQLRQFLSSGDLVKFAKAIPSLDTRNRDIQLLREIIVETSPKELAPAQEVKK